MLSYYDIIDFIYHESFEWLISNTIMLGETDMAGFSTKMVEEISKTRILRKTTNIMYRGLSVTRICFIKCRRCYPKQMFNQSGNQAQAGEIFPIIM